MRLPRVRCTVGMLALAVAVSAANFRGFRHFYETDLYTGGSITYRLLPAGVGVIPLFNVAAIATFAFATRQLRRLRHPRVASPRSAPPAVAYFSLLSLALGGLVCLYMPDLIPLVDEVLYAATGYAARGSAAIFGEPGGTTWWVVLDSAVLGVLLSGPPLLLTWAGQSLASRCAATLPRRRFRVLTGLVSLGFAAVAMAICVTPQPFEEEQEPALDFRVIDEASGEPIAAAFACVTDPFELEGPSAPPRALTGADGRARLACRFVLSGDRNAFQTMASFSPWGRWLEVSAADHQTRRVPLTEVIGQFADPGRLHPYKVALARGATRTDSFLDLAGTYIQGGRGFGGCRLKIEPDGRFAWSEWGCMPPDTQECGHLRRQGDRIELVPLPHFGMEADPRGTARYLAIGWGSRLYLSDTAPEALREFCRAALTPADPSRPADIAGSYRRESDHDARRTGFPRLPLKVWLGFMVEQINSMTATATRDGRSTRLSRNDSEKD